MDAATEKGPDGQHYAVRCELQAHLRDHARHALALDDQVIHGLLKQHQVGLVFKAMPNGLPVQLAVGLAAGGAHGRSLAGIQTAELDAGAVCRAAHFTPQGIDFLHQVSLADTADRRVTAHLAEGFYIVGQQQGTCATTRRGQRGLGTGVAATDHDHLEMLFVHHRCISLK